MRRVIGLRAEIGIHIFSVEPLHDPAVDPHQVFAVAGVNRRGSDIVVAFRDVTGALSVRGGSLNGFELCGATQVSCRWAEARVQGTSVVLLNAGNATRVRYAWGESPVCSLYDDSGLPAGPFEVVVR